METNQIQFLTETFEGHAQQTESGVEYWLARDLQTLLGYTELRNFVSVIDKARTACDVSGHAIRDHFVDVNKTIELGSGSQRNTLLSRGIRPEALPPAEDVKKVERRLSSDEKKALKNPEKLEEA